MPNLRARTRNHKESAMKALVYHGPGQKAWEDVPNPVLLEPTDAIVKMEVTTIC